MSSYTEPSVMEMAEWLNEHYPHSLRCVMNSGIYSDEQFQRRVKYLYHLKQAELKEQ